MRAALDCFAALAMTGMGMLKGLLRIIASLNWLALVPILFYTWA